MSKDNYKVVAQNKKASFDYFIEERYETGITLAGTEVKSVRMGKVSIKESYVQIDKNGEVIIMRRGIFSTRIPLEPGSSLCTGLR